MKSGGNYKEIEKWTESRKTDFEFYQKVLEDVPRGEKLLDVGCGKGQFRDLLAQFDYSGFDIDHNEWVKFQGDFTKEFPIPSESHDIVMLSNVLEHTHSPQLMVNEAFRVLKKGGLVVGSVPFYAEVHEIPNDFLRYTYIMLEKIFKEAGFEVEITPLGTPLGDYKWSQEKLFSQLRNARLPRLKRYMFQLFSFLSKKQNDIFSEVLSTPKQSLIYARRYGFVAKKW